MKNYFSHSVSYRLKLINPEVGNQGFSLIELLFALATASIVAMSGFALFSQSNWSYKVQENVGEAQQNARVAIDRISKDIRTAGFGLPDPPFDDIFGFDTPITVSDSSTGPDTITILGIGYQEGEIIGENEKNQNFICYSSVNKDDTWKLGRIVDYASKKVVSSRRYVSIDGLFYAELDTGKLQADIISTDCGGKRTKLPLNPPKKLKGDFNSGRVYIIQAVEYSIVNTNNVIQGCSEDNPCLVSRDYSTLRGGNRQLLAENIEDLQFAYGLNAANKKYITTYTDTTGKQSSIRAVRITVSARTREKDPKGRISQKRPGLENHPEEAVADSYRRRTLSRIVKLRN